MIAVTCLETRQKENLEHYACFNIEPLEIGQGITLGNSLRRTLLSDLCGCAITGADFRMESYGMFPQEIPISHEFQSIPGIREDALEILLNLKEILLKPGSFSWDHPREPVVGLLESTGPKILSASQIFFPFLSERERPKILNPHQYICTLASEEPRKFRIKVQIDMGKGYRLADSIQKKKEGRPDAQEFPFLVDALFMPVKRVNFRVKLIHDAYGNLKESLLLEIVTNGSVTPYRAFQESLKLLVDLFGSLFLESTFLSLSQRPEKIQDKNKDLKSFGRKQKKIVSPPINL